MNYREMYWQRAGRLPGYASAASIFAGSLETLTPPDLTDPAKVHERRIHEGQHVTADKTPYMVEPLNMTTSRRYRGLAFVGPARTGKTFWLVEGTIMHRVVADPGPVHVVQMTQEAAKIFSLQKINPMIRATPELMGRLIARSGSPMGNIYDKAFTGGTTLTIGFPTVRQLSSRDIQVVIITDRDRMPDDIDGEGDIFPMALKRGQTFGSRAMAIAESSPGRDIADETWSPSTPHEMPPCTGIVALYNNSTRGRYYWRCPHCREAFEPSFGLLHWPEKVTPAEAADKVWMGCPKCGGEINPSMQYRLNLDALNDPDAGWLHENESGDGVVPITSSEVRRADLAGYAINGMHAAYQGWGDILRQYLVALEEYEITGFEGTLKGVVNMSMGVPYLPRSRVDSLDLSPARLREKAQYRELGTAPEGARFITVQVDVQANRFVCSAEAWGEGLERWLIDRWEIAKSEAQEGARRALAPHLYKEDWDPLSILHERVFPVEGKSYGLRPVSVIIDSAGMPGVTDKAYGFWRGMKRKGLDAIYRLYKGDGRPAAPRAKLRQPDAQNQKRRTRASEVWIVFAATNALKDEVAASLARAEPGPLAYHLSSSLPPEVFEEFCAERRAEDGWHKKSQHLRNEALDLAVFAKAAMIVRGGEKIRDWQHAPAWALDNETNIFAVPLDAAGNAQAVPQGKVSAARALAEGRAGFIRKN